MVFKERQMAKIVIAYDEETKTVVLTTSLKFFTKMYDALSFLASFSHRKHVKLVDKIHEACEKAELYL